MKASLDVDFKQENHNAQLFLEKGKQRENICKLFHTYKIYFTSFCGKVLHEM